MAQKRDIDAVLTELPGGIYDLVIEDGDIQTRDSFDTAIIVSLLSDARADESEALLSQSRRGWIGNEYTPGFEIGSKLWLFEQTRLNRTAINGLIDVVKAALQWMVEDGLAIAIREVTVDFLPGTPSLGAGVNVLIERSNSIVEQRYFEFWPQTAIPVDQPPFQDIVPAPSPPSLFVDQSIDGNGTGSFLFGSSQTWGFSDNWTAAGWVKSQDAVSVEHLFGFRDQTPPISDTFSIVKTATPGWQISVNDTFGTNFIDWELQQHDLNQWAHIAVTWDGTIDTLRFFYNGVDRSADMIKTIDLGGTRSMSDIARRCGWGGNIAGTQELDGPIHSFAVWGSVLGDLEIAQLYNDGDGSGDLRENFREYQSAPPLHYWVPGLDTSSDLALGVNYGNSGLSRDFPVGFGITTADLVSDVPE